MIHHVTTGEVDLWHAQGEELQLAFERDESSAQLQNTEIDARWTALCAQNPRLFDGPITSVARFDPEELCLTWRPGSYKSLAVQPDIDTNTWQLSVTALLCLIIDSEPRVLIARRSGGVHTYPGYWEFGPSGGIDPPTGKIDRQYLLAETTREAREELGIDLSNDAATVVGLFRDSRVWSYDVLVRVWINDAPPLAGANWEYVETRWASLAAMGAMGRGTSVGDGDRLCPPSAAVAACIRELVSLSR